MLETSDERELTVMNDECGMMNENLKRDAPIAAIARSSLLRFKCALVIIQRSSLLRLNQQ